MDLDSFDSNIQDLFSQEEMLHFVDPPPPPPDLSLSEMTDLSLPDVGPGLYSPDSLADLEILSNSAVNWDEIFRQTETHLGPPGTDLTEENPYQFLEDLLSEDITEEPPAAVHGVHGVQQEHQQVAPPVKEEVDSQVFDDLFKSMFQQEDGDDERSQSDNLLASIMKMDIDPEYFDKIDIESLDPGWPQPEENKEEEEEKNWVLTSRFFLVDSVGGVRSGDTRPDVIRYLESLELRISLVNTRESPDKPGMIHPPLAVLKYREITKEEAKDGAEVAMKFSVSYKMDMKEAHKDVEISVGVLSVFAVLLSAVETWSWSRRSGKLAVDLSSLVMLLFTAAGYLSYVFLCVIFFSSLYWFIFFKQQTFVHVVLPTEEQEQFIKHYLISAFALKLINILFLLYSQITVDVFLLDWER